MAATILPEIPFAVFRFSTNDVHSSTPLSKGILIVAHLKLESEDSGLGISIAEAKCGFYVVTYDKCSYWIGAVLAIRDGKVVRLTEAGTAEKPPSFPERQCFDSTGTRVRPLRPGEKLVCVK